ncbi:MAG: hypothetical protein JSS20_14465, partial [Proteobacteria bacterium]|nr:hypothetical protein [Pseudomonadota bacterium]
LADELTLELVGNDFLQLQLKARSPKDLGRKLEAVVSRFIEALLPAQDLLSAMQVLVERRKEELEVADRDLKKLQSEIGPSVEDTLKVELGKYAALKSQLDQAIADREQASKSILALKRQVGALKNAATKVNSGAQDSDKAATDAQKAGVPADPNEELRKAEAQVVAIDKEIQSITAIGEQQRRKIDDLRRIDDRYQAAAAEVNKARSNYDAVVRRFNSPLTVSAAPNILNAPERIKIIDLPRDPVFPATSGMKVFVLAMAGALALSIALAGALELLDSTVRRADQFEQLTGVPVLARIPWPSGEVET